MNDDTPEIERRVALAQMAIENFGKYYVQLENGRQAKTPALSDVRFCKCCFGRVKDLGRLLPF